MPTVEEIFAELPALLVASGELSPRRLRDAEGNEVENESVYAVSNTLSAPWSNIDFEPDLRRFDALELAFLRRQIERGHRDQQIESRRSIWVLSELSVAELSDWKITEREEPWGFLALEVPVFTLDRTRAVLRGQRCETFFAEDFEHWLHKVEGRWTSI